MKNPSSHPKSPNAESIHPESKPTSVEEPREEGLDETTCSPCAECGMLTSGEDYHPYGACLMFKACHDGAVVRANLWAIQERSYDIGRRAGENCKPSTEAIHSQANAEVMARTENPKTTK